MSDIGVRELKAHASEIVRQVKEQRERYVITHRGHPVAMLVPIEESQLPGAEWKPDQAETAWDELTRLGQEISQGWQAAKTSTEILSDMRR